MTPHVLYRMFDAEGALLYVGITNNPKARFRTHSKTKAWWEEVANIAVEHFDTREALAYAEYQAIVNEHPLYNIALAPSERPAPVVKKCPTCDAPSPNLFPEWEVLVTDDGLLPFCTDPYHWPLDQAVAERVHAHRALLRESTLLRMSEAAAARLERMRQQMAPLSALLEFEPRSA